jgi:hypothetical protein
MENDKRSRAEAFREEFYKECDDITDVAEKSGGNIQQFFERPPTGTHSEVPPDHPEIGPVPDQGLDGGQLTLGVLVVAVMAFETARRIKNRVEAWKGR